MEPPLDLDRIKGQGGGQTSLAVSTPTADSTAMEGLLDAWPPAPIPSYALMVSRKHTRAAATKGNSHPGRRTVASR